MNNIKCPNCGFINFIQNEVCRKCSTGLYNAYHQPQSAQQAYQPQSAYAGGAGGQYQAGGGMRGGQYQNYGQGYANPYPAGGYVSEPKSGAPVLKIVLGVVGGVILLSVLLGGMMLSGKSKVKWRDFRPSGAGITVRMPSEPKAQAPIETPTQMGTMTNRIYISSVTGQGTVMFCHVEFPFTVTDFDEAKITEMLDAEMKNVLKSTNSTLISKKPLTFGGYPALEFDSKIPSNVSSPAGKSTVRLYVATNKLYMLVFTAKEGSELMKGKDQFLNPTVP